MRARLGLLVLLLCPPGALLAHPVSRDDTRPTTAGEQALEGVDAVVEESLRKFGASGVSIAVVKDGKVVLSKGYGVRNAATREPMRDDTFVPIFSIAKQFTSFGAGLLVDENRIAFNAPVKSYLPEFETADPCANSTITLRDLLSHRSGLPELTFLERDKRLTREDAIERLPHLTGLAPPRSIWSYSNYGYGLASRAIEKVAGVSFETFMSSRVFEPLDMTRTSYDYERVASDPNHLHPSVANQGKRVTVPLPRQSGLNAAAGGIYSTAEDLAKWMLAHLSDSGAGGKRLIVPATLQYLHQPAYAFGAGRNGPEIINVGYALGWYNQVYRGTPMIRHGGYSPGVSTELALLPQKRLGVVILANHDPPALVEGLLFTLIDRLLGASSRDWLAEALTEQNAVLLPKVDPPALAVQRKATATRPSHALAEYSGIYHHPAYGDVKVVVRDQSLEIEWAGYATPLAHLHYDIFATTTSDQNSVWAPAGAKASIRFGSGFDGSISSLEIGGLTGVGGVVFRKLAS